MDIKTRQDLRPGGFYLKAGFLILLVTCTGEFLKPYFAPANLVMLYVLGVLFAALRWGRGPGIFAAFLSFLSYDFFLVQPYFSFTPYFRQNMLIFIGLAVMGIIVSKLILKTKEQEDEMGFRNVALKLQSALLHSISHDLRTPLASITGSLSVLVEDKHSEIDGSAKRELLENAFEESERLNRIVGNLLDTTRMEAGTLKTLLSPAELRDVIGVSLKELKNRLKGRTVNVLIQRGFPEISMDFSLMVKAFLNLVDNAIKYSPDHSTILISATLTADGQAKIEVADEGIGIAAADLERVFDKFYRSAASSQTSGLGLGLSIVKGVIEAHGGTLSAKSPSSLGKGTVFSILLPLQKGKP